MTHPILIHISLGKKDVADFDWNRHTGGVARYMDRDPALMLAAVLMTRDRQGLVPKKKEGCIEKKMRGILAFHCVGGEAAHAFVDYVGVGRPHRNAGLATSLLASIPTGQPTYLITRSIPKLLRFYARRGFQGAGDDAPYEPGVGEVILVRRELPRSQCRMNSREWNELSSEEQKDAVQLVRRPHRMSVRAAESILAVADHTMRYIISP